MRISKHSVGLKANPYCSKFLIDKIVYSVPMSSPNADDPAGRGLMHGAKEAYVNDCSPCQRDKHTDPLPNQSATEKLRNGINSFFDNNIQPSAARDASRGETARHKERPHDTVDADMATTGTAPSTTGKRSVAMNPTACEQE